MTPPPTAAQEREKIVAWLRNGARDALKAANNRAWWQWRLRARDWLLREWFLRVSLAIYDGSHARCGEHLKGSE